MCELKNFIYRDRHNSIKAKRGGTTLPNKKKVKKINRDHHNIIKAKRGGTTLPNKKKVKK